MYIVRIRLIVALTLGLIAGGCHVDSANEDIALDDAGLDTEKEVSKTLANLSSEDQELVAAHQT